MTEHLTDVDQLPSKERDNGLCYEHEYPPGGMSTTVWKKSSCPFCKIARLETALTGISTCSTCEACRGAATMALGERTVEEINAAVDERMDRVERELAQPASRLCERCDSAIKNHECGCAKCGCTQCRLAQPPGDGQQ